MNLNKLILEEFNKILKEDVRISNPKNWDVYKNEKPYKIGDKIKVYHGFYTPQAALIAAKFGISGKDRARRVYSYEFRNNPNGLFVTTNFKTATNFAHGEIGVVMEFNVKYEDLEAPTWKGNGGYFTQGQKTDAFKSKKERDKSILYARAKARKFDDERISKSDNPEVAYWLFGAENQALFVGDLNPNMIKYFYVRDPNYYNKQFEKYKPKEFLKKYYNESKFKNTGLEDSLYKNKDKIFKPNDDLDLEKLRDLFTYNKDYIDTFINDLKNKNYNYTMKQLIDLSMYPKQKLQLKKMFDIPDEIINLNYLPK